MAQIPIYVVTQVAPYRDGPAGVHGVLGQATSALAELASMTGMEAVSVSDVTTLEVSDLERGGVLCLFTIGETPWSGSQRGAIVDSLRSGRLDVVGLHSATDSCEGWPEYGEVVGARFDGHPWTTEFVVEVVDDAHPATAHLPKEWRWKDEVYLFRELRPETEVLLRALPDQLDMTAPGARIPEWGLPLSWCFTVGHGRVFYSALGHFPHAWENPVFLRHISGGLSWVIS